MGWFNIISMDTYKKLFRNLVLSFILISFLTSCSDKQLVSKHVLTGADVLLSEKLELIKNKKLGIITNHTALLSTGAHLVDTLFGRDDINIISLFGPEHGIRGDAPDGHSIKDGIDSKTGLNVYSLYGKTRKPSQEMLKNIDVLIFDIQDIGARFYTFISTMFFAIEAAAENNIPIIILDRPNPINGIDVQGPMLDYNFASFVGIEEIPIRHGMTVGELAQLMNQKRLFARQKIADLRIVNLENWKRSKFYNDCGIHWIKPSPNMPNLETAIVYPGLCLLEGTNVSEGRGTLNPFLQFGSPFINSTELINKLDSLDIIGCTLTPIEFTPKSIPNMSTSPKYKDQKCFGIIITEIDEKKFNPVKFGVKLIYSLNVLYPENFTFRENWIDKLWGSKTLRESILEGQNPLKIIDGYQTNLNNFKEYRKQFLLY